MTAYVFPPAAVSSVAIQGQMQRFPVRRIICVGRNYAAHAREMGIDPTREAPFFFYKPTDAVVDTGASVAYPPLTENLHYEAELVVAIGQGGQNIQRDDALEHVYGYAVGLDLTRRDLQQAARDAGRPWDWGKGFDRSAPCGPIHPVSEVGHLDSGRIWLSVNGEIKQDADLSDLIWSVSDIVSIVSQSISLAAGDLIYTGTPEGVGPIVKGDKLAVGIAGLDELHISIQ